MTIQSCTRGHINTQGYNFMGAAVNVTYHHQINADLIEADERAEHCQSWQGLESCFKNILPIELTNGERFCTKPCTGASQKKKPPRNNKIIKTLKISCHFSA